GVTRMGDPRTRRPVFAPGGPDLRKWSDLLWSVSRAAPSRIRGHAARQHRLRQLLRESGKYRSIDSACRHDLLAHKGRRRRSHQATRISRIRQPPKPVGAGSVVMIKIVDAPAELAAASLVGHKFARQQRFRDAGVSVPPFFCIVIETPWT